MTAIMYRWGRRSGGCSQRISCNPTTQCSSTSYNMYQRLDCMFPVSDFGSQVVLEKRYVLSGSDRYNWYAYTPLTSDGRDWIEWYFGTEVNPSQVGSARLLRASRARLYDSTGYALAYNDAARSGTWFEASPATIANIDAVSYCIGVSGEYVTYTISVPDNGSVLWEWVGVSVCGRAYVTIKDSGGTEIPSGKYAIPETGGNRYVDTQTSGNIHLHQTVLAERLDVGTYTVKILSAGTGRVYDRALYSCNTDLPGNVETDPFIVDADDPVFIGISGDMEYAAYVRKSTSTDSTDYEYCGGVHGYESALYNLNISVDGNNITPTFTSSYYKTRWVGSRINFSFDTDLTTRVGSTSWATLTYSGSLTNAGYEITLSREALVDVNVMQEYLAMLMAQDNQTGVYNRVTIDSIPPETTVLQTATPAVQITHYPSPNVGSVFFSDNYAALINVNISNSSLLQRVFVERTDGYIKDYRAGILVNNIENEVLVSAGDVYNLNFKYRCGYTSRGGFLDLFT